ncbi:hypothetical protein GLOIN_2v1878126 [Rhizophagus clarus]|uniref:Uncharacterized protein n=1 Tax=Rhizophagus clarus TaxID=94130 RepID=A0A8H3QCM8_9GLOM|nr:hypothetical protein GLOIN_2v1878126 [Rhizophagus clarus]
MQSKINSLRKINLKLLAKITELKKKNAERDKEKTTLIAKLNDDIKEIKQSSASTNSVKIFDICQSIYTKTKSLEESKIDIFLNEVYKKSISNKIRKRNKEKKLQRESACKDLIKKISTSISYNAPIQKQLRGTSHDSISQVTEILLTSAFDKSIEEIIVRDRISIKKVKGLIYDFILTQNSDTKHPALYKKIEKARKIYRLTKKTGLDKVKYIKTYSTTTISKFTNGEIQRVIDHFTKNSNMGFTDNPNTRKQDDDVPEKSDRNNVLEVQVHLLDLAKTRSSTAS